MRIFIMALCCTGFSFAAGCGGSTEEGTDSVESGELDACDSGDDGDACGVDGTLEEQENGIVPETMLESCPGNEGSSSYPESYGEFCAQMVTEELKATGNKCFYAPEPQEFGCYCKICAIQGAELNCVHEICK